MAEVRTKPHLYVLPLGTQRFSHPARIPGGYIIDSPKKKSVTITYFSNLPPKKNLLFSC